MQNDKYSRHRAGLGMELQVGKSMGSVAARDRWGSPSAIYRRSAESDSSGIYSSIARGSGGYTASSGPVGKWSVIYISLALIVSFLLALFTIGGW